VLDLGCGEGRNAFMLAGLGISVTAIDISAESIQKLRQVCARHDVHVDAMSGNVIDFEFQQTYDFVIGHGILHFLDPIHVERMVSNIKRNTKSGGYNVYTVSPFETDREVLAEFKQMGHRNLLKKGQMLSYYHDWNIILHEDYVKWDYHPGAGVHCHPIEKVVFQRGVVPSGVNIKGEKITLETHPSELWIQQNVCQLVRGWSREKVVALLGSPDHSFKYVAEGPQFGFRRFSDKGYTLELIVYGRHVLYSSNGTISGVSKYNSDLVRLHTLAAQ
jgi:SAM-dependent methyltransferase